MQGLSCRVERAEQDLLLRNGQGEVHEGVVAVGLALAHVAHYERVQLPAEHLVVGLKYSVVELTSPVVESTHLVVEFTCSVVKVTHAALAHVAHSQRVQLPAEHL